MLKFGKSKIERNLEKLENLEIIFYKDKEGRYFLADDNRRRAGLPGEDLYNLIEELLLVRELETNRYYKLKIKVRPY